MKTERNILITFALNIIFSIIELFGGLITNSISILSDSLHDFGDALSIGISYILERKSKQKPDENYTYGYARYSILGAFITTMILLVGSIFMMYQGIGRIFNPQEVDYNGMLILAIFGVVINLSATFLTSGGKSLNQKSVNLHTLEDALGWIVVLIGAILMKFINITYIDSIMSIGISIFIFINAIKNFKEILDLFLEKIPHDISIKEIQEHILEIKEVIEVHHLHIWSMDGISNYATMHIVTNTKNPKELKKEIKEELNEHNISHVTIELESEKDKCDDKECHTEIHNEVVHHHHH